MLEGANSENLNMKVLGRNIRTYRKNAGLSQKDLAKALGYSSFTTIQRWEDCTNNPPLSAIIKLSDVFNIPLDKLVSDNPSDIRYLETIAIIDKNPKVLNLLNAAKDFDNDKLDELIYFANFLKIK